MLPPSLLLLNLIYEAPLLGEFIQFDLERTLPKQINVGGEFFWCIVGSREIIGFYT